MVLSRVGFTWYTFKQKAPKFRVDWYKGAYFCKIVKFLVITIVWTAKLWMDVYPPRIAPFLMIQYAFWSSWPDLSFETKLVFFDFGRSSSSKALVVVVVVVNYLSLLIQSKRKLKRRRLRWRRTKKSKKTNIVSNDRSGHDDQNAYWIIKNGAILGG